MKRIHLITTILSAILLIGCHNGPDITSIGVDDNYSVPRLQKLSLATGAAGGTSEPRAMLMWRQAERIAAADPIDI